MNTDVSQSILPKVSPKDQALKSLDQLPPFSPVLNHLMASLADEDVSFARLADLIEERALAHEAMDVSRVARIREDMERAEARRLQPHYIESFFLEAFRRLGGSIHEREPRRYEITHVPAPVRTRDRQLGRGDPVLRRYERVAFEKDLIAPPGRPLAALARGPARGPPPAPRRRSSLYPRPSP